MQIKCQTIQKFLQQKHLSMRMFPENICFSVSLSISLSLPLSLSLFLSLYLYFPLCFILSYFLSLCFSVSFSRSGPLSPVMDGQIGMTWQTGIIKRLLVESPSSFSLPTSTGLMTTTWTCARTSTYATLGSPSSGSTASSAGSRVTPWRTANTTAPAPVSAAPINTKNALIKVESAILAKGCWYLSSTANQITPILEAICWLARIVYGSVQATMFAAHLQSKNCVRTLDFSANTESTARSLWGTISWISQKLYMIRIVDCTFNTRVTQLINY